MTLELCFLFFYFFVSFRYALETGTFAHYIFCVFYFNVAGVRSLENNNHKRVYIYIHTHTHTHTHTQFSILETILAL